MMLDTALLAPVYLRFRAEHPTVPANIAYGYLLLADAGESFEQFMCPGHEWSYSGTAYGGDDPSYHGEGRVTCTHCGADGDA